MLENEERSDILADLDPFGWNRFSLFDWDLNQVLRRQHDDP